MTNLLEDAGLDDENYIYLDKDGIAQKMIEVTVHWNPVPKQVILVTVNRNDSLSYLCFRIGEAMEKYSTFSGLTNLRAINLMNNQVLLPNIGTIGDHVKTGEHLTCDIASNDIWLDVHVDCSLIQLIISFEIKVNFNITIETLQYSLTEIINKVLNTKNVPLEYEESDIELKKLVFEDASEASQDHKRSMMDVKNKKTSDLYKNQQIGDELDYLNRYIVCILEKRKKNDIEIGHPSNSSHSCTVNDTFNELTCTFPIRSLKVEPKVLTNMNEVKSHSKVQNESMNKQKMCNCNVF
ncbi:unnamed protein product [Blepharisma stoltei]|uniref:Uncharacterized protein n=1 Tax=Blepharisma stoltei TaxID=1481888 RepID=A0AAU9KE60_9CILI|nr:unnamed protein product [Blepharisma stoltei]